MEDLVGVGVADAGDDRLGGEHRLHVPRRAAEESRPALSVSKDGVEGVDAQGGTPSTSSGSPTTHSARRFSVPISVTSNPDPPSNPMRRARGLRLGRARSAGSLSFHCDPAAPGQVQHQPLAVEVHAQVLPPPCDRHHGTPHERRTGEGRTVLSAAMAPSSHRRHALAGAALGEKAGESLDLGQLGHAPILPRPGSTPVRPSRRATVKRWTGRWGRRSPAPPDDAA